MAELSTVVIATFGFELHLQQIQEFPDLEDTAMRSLVLMALLILATTLRAAEPPDLLPLLRFYNKATNEHCYTYTEKELAFWREVESFEEHGIIGLVSAKMLPGTVRLYRQIRPNNRFVYSNNPPPKSMLTTVDANFEVYVWTDPGDGRVPIYCSTWTDGTDVFFEPVLESFEKISADSKKTLGVDRLRPTVGPLFYVYPRAEESKDKTADARTANGPKRNPASPNADNTVTTNNQKAPSQTTEALSTTSADEIVKFQPLELESPATSFDMTEDGKLVLITHQASDLVSVYDVQKGEVVQTFVSDSPRSIVCRGDQVFVANFGKGNVSVYSRSSNWKLTKKLRVEKPNVVHIAAGQGKAFADELIVTCHGPGMRASYEDSHTYVVDTLNDRSQALDHSPLATVSADGKVVFTQSSFNLSPSGAIAAFNYKEYTKSNSKPEPIYRCGEAPFVYQVFPGSHWLSEKVVLGGIPIQRLGNEIGLLIIPDLSQKLIYALKDGSIRAHRMSTSFPEIGNRQFEFPTKYKELKQVCNHLMRTRDYILDHPMAYTHGDRLYLFVLTAEGGTVLAAETAVLGKTSTTQNPSDSIASSELPTNEPSGNATTNAPPSRETKKTNDETVSFQPLELEGPASSFDITEDGKLILISHQASDLVSVYDVLKGEVVQTFASESPRSIICRGDQVFVANYVKGTVSAYSRSKNWKLTNEFRVEKPNILHIAAGQGETFAQELIVTCLGDRENHTFLIDVNKNQSRSLGKSPMTLVSFDGKLVIRQDSFGMSVHNYKEFTKPGGSLEPIYRGAIAGHVYQVFSGSYWFSQNTILGGIPIQPLGGEFGRIIIPDYTQKLFYSINESVLRAHRMSTSFPELAAKPVQFHPDYKQVEVFRHDYFQDHPIAYTHGNRLHLFMISAQGGTVLAAETSAIRKEPPSNSPGTIASPTAIANQSKLPQASTESSQSKTTKSSSSGADSDIVKFKPMELEDPATSYDITEDGKLILITHQASDLISVYDVLKGEVVQTFSSDSPRSIISRGDHVFVANYGKGTVSVYSRSKNWKLTNELKVEKPNILHIAAGQGKAFANQLIVTCLDPPENRIYVIDTDKDRSRALGNSPLALVSFDGKLLMTKDSSGFAAYNYKEFTTPNTKAEPIYRGAAALQAYQVFPGSYWFSQNTVLGGVPIQRLDGDFARMIIPDHSQKQFYAINENVMRAHRLTTSFPELAMKPVEFQSDYKQVDKVFRHSFPHRDYIEDHPIAYTHGNRLFLFMMTAQAGTVLVAETAAISNESAPPNTASETPSPEALANAPAPGDAERSQSKTTEASPVADNESVTFHPMELESPATSFDMTEDGKFILLTHQPSDVVSVYDVLKGRVVNTIASEAPRSILCRGDQVFVANFGKGTISIYSRSRNWKLIDRLRVEKPNVVHMSAGKGKDAADELIVTCHGPGVTGSYQDCHTYAIDISKDRSRLLGHHSLASVSADGKTLITQGSFNVSSPGEISAFNYREFTKPNSKPQPISRCREASFVYQVFPGSNWLSDNVVFGGAPIHRLDKDFGLMLVPDYTQKLIYALNESVVRAHRFATGFPELAMRRIELPTSYREFHKVSRHFERQRSYILDHPFACTHGGRLYLFVLTAEGGNVLVAETSAFEPRIDSANDSSQVADSIIADSSSVTKSDKDQSDKTDSLEIPMLDVEDQLKKEFPEMISTGKEFRYSWKLSQPAKFELMSDISALTVSPQGELIWRVDEKHVGKQEIKLRVSIGEESSIARLTTEVVDAQLFASVKGDKSKLHTLHRIPMELDRYVITPTANFARLLLLQGDELSLLSASGQTVERKLVMPKRYDLLKDRNDYLVGVTREDGFRVELINKKTMKVQRSIELKQAGFTIAEVSDLVLHPAKATSFVSVKNEKEVPKYSVFMIEEDSGEITPLEVFGNWLQISPDGNRLYSGYKDIYRRGSSFHLNPGWKLLETPEYGPIDMLLAWDLRGNVTLKQAISAPGANGFGIRMSPDGSRVVYLSFTGDLKRRGDLMAWNTSNFKSKAVAYETHGKGVTTELAFHPTLPWLAVPGVEAAAILFHQETGAVLDNKLLITSSGLNGDKVEKMDFSPDGKCLLFVCSGENGRYLRAVELKLTPEEKAAKRRSQASVPKSNDPKPPVVAATELDALNAKSQDSSLSPKEIGRKYLDAVVSIIGEEGSGSGFFIGKSGYLLTSAHVIEGLEKVKVLHNGQPGGKEFVPTESEARVIRVDESLDVALLKVSTAQPMPFVVLSADDKVETGESVIVIGSPGLGNSILNRTMTNGIVSNPDREINGVHYIQTSASINPGNSGGPMFDSRGCVIGLIELKGKIEGTGFAIPSVALRKFLIQATSVTQ